MQSRIPIPAQKNPERWRINLWTLVQIVKTKNNNKKKKTAVEQSTAKLLITRFKIVSLSPSCVCASGGSQDCQPPFASPKCAFSLFICLQAAPPLLLFFHRCLLHSLSHSKLVSTHSGGRRGWMMSSKCCECSLAGLQPCICMSRAATGLPLLWPIKTPLPASATAILMRHPWLQQERRKRRMAGNEKERKGLIAHRVHIQQS